MKQLIFKITLKTLLMINIICVLILPFTIYVKHSEFNIDGLNFQFVLLVNIASILFPLILALQVFSRASATSIGFVSFIFLCVTILFSLSLISYITNELLQLYGGLFDIKSVEHPVLWSVKLAAFFTFIYSALLIYFRIRSHRLMRNEK